MTPVAASFTCHWAPAPMFCGTGWTERPLLLFVCGIVENVEIEFFFDVEYVYGRAPITAQ